MKKILGWTLACTVAAALAGTAEARKVPGNPLGPPTLVSADFTTGECDGDELTADDECIEVVFTNLACTESNEPPIKYSVAVTTGFDLVPDEFCADDTYYETDFSVAGEVCDPLSCDTDGDLIADADCISALVPVSALTTQVLIGCDGTGGTNPDVCDPELDPGDVNIYADYDSLCVKVKGINPPKKGPKSISQSTEFSTPICPVENAGCPE